MTQPVTTELTREELERLYAQLLSVVPVLAQALGKPSPILSRRERLEHRAPLRGCGTIEQDRSSGGAS